MSNRVTTILNLLPADLEWLVLFDLGVIRMLAGDEDVRRMYNLTGEADLDAYTHVVLTSAGAFLLLADQESLCPAHSSELAPPPAGETMARRHAGLLKRAPVDRAHCLGLGREGPLEPVLLFVEVDGEYGRAEAFFREPPTEEHYDLLKAVGVEYLGGQVEDGYFVARYSNHLPTHIQGGLASAFQRTDHCNKFSLRHGRIDAELEASLREAAGDRLKYGRRRGFAALEKMAARIGVIDQSLTCRPPAPARPVPYGDVVPWGLARWAAESLVQDVDPVRVHDFRTRLKDYLLSKSQGGLWPYHTGGLPTATDSALVLLGYPDRRSILELERFGGVEDGYRPQTEEDLARAGPGAKHWIGPDLRHHLPGGLSARPGRTGRLRGAGLSGKGIRPSRRAFLRQPLPYGPGPGPGPGNNVLAPEGPPGPGNMVGPERRSYLRVL